MAQSKRASRTSHGGRQKSNLAHEAKRQAKFAAKRGTDKEYKYQKNPYKSGTPEYYAEEYERLQKRKSSRLPMVQFRSIMAKLDNQLKAEAQAAKKKGSPKKERREE